MFNEIVIIYHVLKLWLKLYFHSWLPASVGWYFIKNSIKLQELLIATISKIIKDSKELENVYLRKTATELGKMPEGILISPSYPSAPNTHTPVLKTGLLVRDGWCGLGGVTKQLEIEGGDLEAPSYARAEVMCSLCIRGRLLNSMCTWNSHGSTCKWKAWGDLLICCNLEWLPSPIQSLGSREQTTLHWLKSSVFALCWKHWLITNSAGTREIPWRPRKKKTNKKPEQKSQLSAEKQVFHFESRLVHQIIKQGNWRISEEQNRIWSHWCMAYHAWSIIIKL